jgi:hypothetical protein
MDQPKPELTAKDQKSVNIWTHGPRGGPEALAFRPEVDEVKPDPIELDPVSIPALP